MSTVWMVRASGGKFADDFVENGYVGIDFGAKIDLTTHVTREAIAAALQRAGHPESANSVGQILRIRETIQVKDVVITYDTARRQYPVGEVVGPYQYLPSARYPHQRPVKWLERRVNRDDLSQSTINRLGSLLTIFQLRDDAANELLAIARGTVPPPPSKIEDEPDVPSVGTLRAEVADKAKEYVKDKVAKVSWEQMQSLVAGILRAMGFKTRISPSGPDRGKDIIASPDGLGLRDPRIIVEVKHRDGSMGAPDVRSFLAALKDTDRGLYVSTGGFSKEAYYEAERARMPVALLDLDDLVELLLEHYDNVDKETVAIVTLRPIYWPVD